MLLTLGEEPALTERTITETLERVTKEIKKEEAEKFQKEQEAHSETQKQLAATKAYSEALQKRLFWKCSKKARLCAKVVSGLLVLLLLTGILFGLALRTTNPFVGWVLILAVSVLGIMTFANLCWGTTVHHIHGAVEQRCLTYFLKQETDATGIKLGSLE